MTRVVQLLREDDRRVALVDEPNLRVLDGVPSLYVLAGDAIARGVSLAAAIDEHVGNEVIDYDSVHAGESEWHLLLPVDHPVDAARCLVSGTGLTHLGSATDRQAMHHTPAEALTDSMKMFRWGLEGGRPQPGCIGVAQEWF
jgi:hypothetical protein